MIDFSLLAARLTEPLFFIPFLIMIWVGSCWSISAFSGWGALAQRFRAPQPARPLDAANEQFRFVSGTLRAGLLPTRFNNCLTVTITPDGFGLSMFFVVRLFHPPLFFPWTAVQAMSVKRRVFSNSAVVVFRGQLQELLIHGGPGQALLTAFGRHQARENAEEGTPPV